MQYCLGTGGLDAGREFATSRAGQLALPTDRPLLKADMKRLTGLEGRKRGITDLTGLEHGTYLQWTNLGENEIRDISPLANLVGLEGLWIYTNPISNLSPLANLVNLKQLNLAGCEISDLRPLANLRNLEYLILAYNQIQDITPLANLTNLTELRLHSNSIVDIRPLANLTRLETLHIHDNRISDVSPLMHLLISEFSFDEVCELDGLPTQERFNNKRYPSAFHPWYDIGNRPSLSRQEGIAAHDLSISGAFGFEIYFQHTDQGVVLMGPLE